MPVSNRKLYRFMFIREEVKKVASDFDLDKDLHDSPYLRTIGFRFILALFSKNIRTVRDLVFCDINDVIAAVNSSETAISKMTSSLRRLCLSCGLTPKITKKENTFVPNIFLAKSFSILEKMNEKQLDVLISLSNIDNVRILNAFSQADIQTFRDLKETGIEKVQRLPGLGRKSFSELLDIINLLYLEDYKDEKANNYDVINQFRNHLLEANRIVNDNYDVQSLEKQLNDYIGRFVDSLHLERNGDIFKLRALSKNMTLDKTGKEYGITRERVRQIVIKINTKVVNSFTDRNKASADNLIKCFYTDLCSIDKEIVLYPIYVLSQNKGPIADIIRYHLKAINLLLKQITIIKPEPEPEKQIKSFKKRKPKIIPDNYVINSVLSAVEANNGAWRVNKLADLLQGKFDIVFEKEFLANKRFYGICKTYSRGYIVDSIYYLLHEELLSYMPNNTYRISISDDGRIYLEHKKPI